MLSNVNSLLVSHLLTCFAILGSCGVMCVGTDDEKGACYGGIGDLRSQAAVIGFWLKEGGLVEGIGASSPGGGPGG